MTLNEKNIEVEAALEELGYEDIRELRIDCPADRRANVYLNGEYFGIYDFARRTFVD